VRQANVTRSRAGIDRGEARWLERARCGDEQAFAELVEAYQRPVFNLCYRMLGETGEAEDAAQESFLRAANNLRRYDPARSFSTWLLAIASHHCIDQLRRRRLVVDSLEELEPWEEPADQTPGPESAASRREGRQAARALLSRLGPQDRAVVVLRYWEDLSTEEIASALSLTVKAVKSRLHRARKQMAEAWIEDHAEPAWNGGRADVASAL
jgi:RNA polymerase sigma-70 factor (ECF subfamily)